jgi:hypothetical protein
MSSHSFLVWARAPIRRASRPDIVVQGYREAGGMNCIMSDVWRGSKKWEELETGRHRRGSCSLL